MRRVIAAFLTMALLVGVVGCGGLPSSESQTEKQKSEVASKSIKMANPFPAGGPNPAKTGGDMSGGKKL
jgi:hypothetical protein